MGSERPASFFFYYYYYFKQTTSDIAQPPKVGIGQGTTQCHILKKSMNLLTAPPKGWREQHGGHGHIFQHLHITAWSPVQQVALRLQKTSGTFYQTTDIPNHPSASPSPVLNSGQPWLQGKFLPMAPLPVPLSSLSYQERSLLMRCSVLSLKESRKNVPLTPWPSQTSPEESIM